MKRRSITRINEEVESMPNLSVLPECDAVRELEIVVIDGLELLGNIGDMDGYCELDETERLDYYLEKCGINVRIVGTVTKNTNYVICNHPESLAMIQEKARRFNVPIIPMAELIGIFGDSHLRRDEVVNYD